MSGREKEPWYPIVTNQEKEEKEEKAICHTDRPCLEHAIANSVR